MEQHRVGGHWVCVDETKAEHVRSVLAALGDGSVSRGGARVEVSLTTELPSVELNRRLHELAQLATLGMVTTSVVGKIAWGKGYQAKGPHPQLQGMPKKLKRVARAVLGLDRGSIRQGLKIASRSLEPFIDFYWSLETLEEKALWMEAASYHSRREELRPVALEMLDLDVEIPEAREAVFLALCHFGEVVRTPATPAELRLAIEKVNRKLGRTGPGARSEDRKAASLVWLADELTQLIEDVEDRHPAVPGVITELASRIRSDPALRLDRSALSIAGYLESARADVPANSETVVLRLEEILDSVRGAG